MVLLRGKSSVKIVSTGREGFYRGRQIQLGQRGKDPSEVSTLPWAKGYIREERLFTEDYFFGRNDIRHF